MFSVFTTDEFDDWFANLKDGKAKQRIQMRIDRIELGNFGDWKSVGDKVSELRIDYGAGYRIYFFRQGIEVVVLLAGGIKKTQDKDIDKAKELAKSLED